MRKSLNNIIGQCKKKCTNVPKGSIKISISNDSFDNCESIKYDHKILSRMEFKILMVYDSDKHSRYSPSTKELEVIKRNLDLRSTTKCTDNVFLSTMIENICDDINFDAVPSTGYNKRALISIIDAIKEYWILKYEGFVFRS